MCTSIVGAAVGVVEEFRKVSGWEHYEVSNLGRVRCLRWSIGRGLSKTGLRYLKPRLAKKKGIVKFAMVTLKDVNRDWQIAISRLVLMTFVGPPEGDQEACHYPDPDPANNRLDNLCWGAKWQNEQHKTEQGMKQKRLTASQIKEIRSTFAQSGESQTEFAKRYEVDAASICRVLSRKSWMHIF